ncbi:MULTISPECIES: potassium channel family protein [Dethiosulfovibrio]|jgi:trk system potassium uptake protein TrkA|uniref:TrkA family potassium uptake protein n=2 Tax=Dethiosulfovibrio TaxID=47054 RepID=A0ABS9EQ72_9BACT|nr:MULTISPECIES: TrkA family potassium uptake protein [Dethiosulfovibrio]MCF4115015.1 TrkA family potassium uptake protein [Dethiosulfovibrio russensis]MCF4143338.1 TrkA family potassium uptake protein [Dethiosulfovibrio marinus]MCF4145543.1 TrkA family potassium uptake protein [Dethiosulfovibrio acidaminovorans]
MARETKMYFVVGLGRFGLSLCERLVALGQRVVAVDMDPDKVAEVADTVDYAAELDASDEEALIKVGAKEADVAVVAIGENVEASILTTAILKGLGIDRLVSRAQTALHARVLARVGADRVIFPEKDMGVRLAEQFVNPWLSNFSQIPGNGYIVGELKPLPSMVGKSLVDLNFRSSYGASVLLLERDDAKMMPGPDSVIREGDKLMLVGDRERLADWIYKLEKIDSEGEV